MEPFAYEKLPTVDHIRLIRMLPPAHDGAIRCSLRAVHRHVAEGYLGYRALSYVWGNPKDTLSIWCNDNAMHVTAGLEEALRHLQKSDFTDRALWVDQICIDQADLEHKSQQVKRMGATFAGASQVIAWTGPGYSDANIVYDIVRRIWKHVGSLQEKDRWETHMLTEQEFCDRGLPSWANERAWHAFANYFKRAYFQRIWMVQELALAKEASIVCGPHVLPWMAFSWAATWMKLNAYHLVHYLDLDIDGIERAFRMMKWTSFPLQGWPTLKSFPNTLLDLRVLDATNPRDKLYALLGLLPDVLRDGNDAVQALLAPNYRKAVLEVYRDAAYALILAGQNLDVLSAVEHVDDVELSTWPSWVPRWDQRLTVNRQLHAVTALLGYRFCEFYASRGIGTAFRGTTAIFLNVHGLRIGYVTETSELLRIGKNENYPISPTIKQLRQDFASDDKPYPTGEPRIEAFALTLICHRTPIADFQQDRKQLLSEFHAHLEHTAKGPPTICEFTKAAGTQSSKDTSAVVSRNKSNLVSRDYLPSVDKNVNRRLFATDNGHLGMGPRQMAPGDVVVILWGGAVPFVLRRRPQGDGYWLIGECYVHGVMFGELIGASAIKNQEVFVLR